MGGFEAETIGTWLRVVKLSAEVGEGSATSCELPPFPRDASMA